MSIAKAVQENLDATGRFEIPNNGRAAAFSYGAAGGGKVALIFEDGSELSMVIERKAIQETFWSKAGESEYSLGGHSA